MTDTSPLGGFAIVSHCANGGDYPENTLLGIVAALRDGVDAIEIDVRATADAELVLLHDLDFARVAGSRQRVANLTLADLEAIRVVEPHGRHPGQPVPSLRAAIEAIAGRAAIVIDYVELALTEPIVALVNEMGVASWTWFCPHQPRLADRLREACPEARVFLGWSPDEGIIHAPADAVSVAERHGLAGLMANHAAIDHTTVDYAHARGLAVTCWTVNTPARMSQLLRLGVDGITTDYPATLAEVARGLGIARAPRSAP